MQGQSITTYYTLRRAPNTPREVVGIIFRHRRLVVLSFLATFAGVVIATVLFGMKYEAQTEILVKRQRPADSHRRVSVGEILAASAWVLGWMETRNRACG